MPFRTNRFVALSDGDAGTNPTGVMQSVRAGVLHPLTSSMASTFTGAVPRKSKDTCLGRDTDGSTFAWTAHGLCSRLQCGWLLRQHKHLTLATHAFDFPRDDLSENETATCAQAATSLNTLSSNPNGIVSSSPGLRGTSYPG